MGETERSSIGTGRGDLGGGGGGGGGGLWRNYQF